ncbi:olfactory receptor 6F1-like [Aquarana catesbeiana]|uniref:olfactory receptor 6F1-like n=1 Tax=Aquarana catesbeiana TaxID=8400 RepID=UPI003CCA2ED1
MVYPENCTAVTEILVIGFKPYYGFRIPMFVAFLIIYLLIFSENLMIIYIIWSSNRLKSPMFFSIKSMCVLELVSITNMLPMMLHYIVSERPTITVTGCSIQSVMYGIAGYVGSFHYALMSYDRYLAVCHPLRYSSFVNDVIYLRVVIAFWIISIAFSGVIAGLLSQLQCCGPNTIDHLFCDFYPFLDLVTSDTTPIRFYTVVISALMILITILSVFITYTFIIHSILKIPSSSGRKKTFSTCSSHLIVFSMQYSASFSVYVLPAEIVTHQVTNIYTIVQFCWTPLMNPLIYTFNNKEFRAECMRKIKKINRSTWFK